MAICILHLCYIGLAMCLLIRANETIQTPELEQCGQSIIGIRAQGLKAQLPTSTLPKPLNPQTGASPGANS